ncbi:unnamed protein product, partial [Ectocarpus sp. 12 AP-2014]
PPSLSASCNPLSIYTCSERQRDGDDAYWRCRSALKKHINTRTAKHPLSGGVIIKVLQRGGKGLLRHVTLTTNGREEPVHQKGDLRLGKAALLLTMPSCCSWFLFFALVDLLMRPGKHTRHDHWYETLSPSRAFSI